MSEDLDLGPINFFWRMAEPGPDESGIPAFLPFAFSFEAERQLIVQKRNAQVGHWLREVYQKESNIGYLQPNYYQVNTYGGEFFAFIQRSLAGASFPVKSALDIGCGGCYLLGKLQEMGLTTYAIDPSPVARQYTDKLGIPLHVGFYPAEHPFPKVDLILSTGVIEHVPDPVGFLKSHHRDLGPRGLLALSTPDAEPNIRLGDVAMAWHEHLSYFDAESLRLTLEQAGYRVLALEKAGYGASLYCFAESTDVTGAATTGSKSSPLKFERFSGQVRRAIAGMKSYLETTLADEKSSVGFYVPLRALPYLSMTSFRERIRFFDDDPAWRGKRFDGFDVLIENFADLVSNPCSDILVMSLPHGKAITKKIKDQFGDTISVTLLEDVLVPEASNPHP